MHDRYFRPRRRLWLRLVLATSVLVVLLASAVTVVWLRTNVVPPDCRAPETLTLVHQSLTGRFKLPATVVMENIQTLAGGYLAFRFACAAELGNINPNDLTPGTTIPGTVYYTSRLTEDGQHHEVTVSIQPLLVMKRVQ